MFALDRDGERPRRAERPTSSRGGGRTSARCCATRNSEVDHARRRDVPRAGFRLSRCSRRTSCQPDAVLNLVVEQRRRPSTVRGRRLSYPGARGAEGGRPPPDLGVSDDGKRDERRRRGGTRSSRSSRPRRAESVDRPRPRARARRRGRARAACVEIESAPGKGTSNRTALPARRRDRRADSPELKKQEPVSSAVGRRNLAAGSADGGVRVELLAAVRRFAPAAVRADDPGACRIWIADRRRGRDQ